MSDFWDEQGAVWESLEGRIILKAQATYENWQVVRVLLTDGSLFLIDADGDVMIEEQETP